MRDVLGDHLLDFILGYGRSECDAFDRSVSPWETDRYFATL